MAVAIDVGKAWSSRSCTDASFDFLMVAEGIKVFHQTKSKSDSTGMARYCIPHATTRALSTFTHLDTVRDSVADRWIRIRKL